MFTHLLSILAGIAFFASLWQFWLGNVANGGAFLALVLFLAGIALQKIPHLKGTFYTFLVLAAVLIGMSRPEWFLEWSVSIPALGLSVERLKCTDTIIPLLQMVMFGMGTQLTAGDFRSIAIQPKGVIIGMVSQFSIMPLSGFFLATLCSLLPEEYGLGPEILAGIILIGCSPSGIASNVMAFIAKANVALSVTLTSCATLVAPVVTPFLLKTLAGQYIEMDFLQMTSDITHLIIFPIIAGLLFRVVCRNGWNVRREIPHMLFYTGAILVIHLLFALAGLYPLAEGLSRGGILVAYCVGGSFLAGQILHPVLARRPWWLERTITTFSALAVCAVVLFTVVVGRDALLKVGGILMVVCLLHNLMGYVLGYHLARWAGMNERDRRTLAIEVGMQNGGLATSIAVGLGKVATLGLAPTIFGCFMNVTGSLLAARWSKRPTPQDSAMKNEAE
ncbi:MAG: bile acid:sodium symporter family protein [Planctomycetia bacterium]|nr:bile acid:sodium symporter family protein [Planctomycetia bacterium]